MNYFNLQRFADEAENEQTSGTFTDCTCSDCDLHDNKVDEKMRR